MSPLTIDPKATALVLIDLQQGIVGFQLAPRPAAEVVKNSASLAEAFRRKGATVVLVRVEMSELVQTPADRPMRDPNAPPPPASASELVKEIGPEPGDLVVTKRQWGAFHATPLDQYLRRRGIRTIVLGGIATNFGVESTARAAVEHGYEVVLVEDAMATLSPEAHQFAVNVIFPMLGRVRDTATVIKALG
jgi:nicotinamidase-related amidase